MPVIKIMNLVVSKELTDDINGATYDTPYVFSKAIYKAKITPVIESAQSEGDGQVVERSTKVVGYKIVFDLREFTQTERAFLAGRTIVNGIDSSSIDDEAPNFCVMFKAKKSNKKYKYYKYLKVQFSEPTEDLDGSVKTNYQVMSLEGDAIPRIYDGVPRRIADEDSPTYTASVGTGWFTSGDITVDVTAPTIASTTPANNATGIVVGSTFAWVFSEAILPDCIKDSNFYLIKDSDGSAVAGALSQSADKKTVTFTPTSNLTAATAYRAIVTKNAKDLSGNALAANDVRKFTTA